MAAKSKLDKLKEEAVKLAIPFDEKIEEKDLAKLVADKKAAEIEERKINKDKLKQAEDDAKTTNVVLKNVFGDDIDEADYFYAKDGKGKAPSYFNKICGYPVDREELLVVFNRIFKPEHGFLFYKARDKEVYLVIIPLKHAHTVGGSNESLDGDFQKHAMSFIGEGSVNADTLKMKLERVFSTVRISN